ncbi:MAG TPA: sigma-70 family RNA polymerase sigma factor [Alphaproteobacteria bacterium]|jgi:RNA polymerase sigma-70 factor (ECF subfamily)
MTPLPSTAPEPAPTEPPRTAAAPERGTGAADPLADLLAAAARGDDRAFARLYELTSPKLFALTLGILKRRDRAEETLQEIYTRLWRSAHRYDPAKGPAMGWIVTIARNAALTALEREPRDSAGPEEPDFDLWASADPNPLEQVMQSSAARALARCLQRLDERQRRTIALAYFEGLTHVELAERLAAPVGTVKSWIRRGLARLNQCLSDDQT